MGAEFPPPCEDDDHNTVTPNPPIETISDDDFFKIMDSIYCALPAWYRTVNDTNIESELVD